VHDIPQPKATVKPKTRIDTLSAYEPSLVDSRPLRKLGRLTASALDDPLVGGMGARQLKSKGRPGKKPSAASARFQQLESEMDARLPGTSALPAFPPSPTRAITAVGSGSSFDNRDGPPKLLDDILPLRAELVEDLDPLTPKAESAPVGWGSAPTPDHHHHDH